MMFQSSSLPSLTGKTFIVTGGNTGIGYVTCLELANHGARVYMGARSEAKAVKAIAEIKEQLGQADVRLLLLDHTKLASVVEAAERFKSDEGRLHGLILNGGIMNMPYEVTLDGIEIQFQVNYVAHWLLTSRLLPVLLSTARVGGPGSMRVVCVSSDGHKHFGVKKILYAAQDIREAGDYGRYGISKLADVLQAKTLNDLYGPGSASAKAGSGEIWTAAVHPGFIDTQLNVKNRERASWKLAWIHPVLNTLGIMRPWKEGCLSNLFVAAGPDFKEDMSGQYFDHKAQVHEPSAAAQDLEERRRLEAWTVNTMQAGGFLS